MKKVALQKHRKAISDLYKKHGVGSTIAHRMAFWTTWKGPYCFSHNPTKKQKLALIEEDYLIDLFPQDYRFC